jgi:DUF971 family protein
MSTSTAVAAPIELVLRDGRRTLELRWADGHSGRISAALLRSSCRCASCEHKRRSGGEIVVPASIALADARPFGVAALQPVFSDGHQRGLFPWAYLRELSDTARAAAAVNRAA